MKETLKISTKSNPNSVAGALAAVIKDGHVAEMELVGAGALNQAIKAVAIARGFLAPSGVELVCIPSFINLIIDDEERTGIRLVVKEV